ncbi:MAG: prepilin peptidase [Desulfobacterales bacterium]|jgi:leader peptidase (prepilin peptidase)/N-methyltransferase
MLLSLYVFILGLCVGSFMNVCIYRIAEGRSIVRPASACPACETPIRFYDNIPVLSYLWLRGKCRACGAGISIRYPLVELLGGLTALAAYLKFGLSPATGIYFVFCAALEVIAFIDIDRRIIPDRITLPGIPLFFGASLFLPGTGAIASALGILIGGGSLLLIAWLYAAVTGKEGMGGGDIKLLAMIGALVGWKGVLFTIFVSSAVGTVVGIVLMIRAGKGMKMSLPFGPFLSIGAIAYVFFGPASIALYLHQFG